MVEYKYEKRYDKKIKKQKHNIIDFRYNIDYFILRSNFSNYRK